MPTSILVVDDDPSGRSMLGLYMRQVGFEVRTAAGGEEALDILKDGRYDWMVTDAHMAPMSGCELSRKAKTLQPDLRIIMVSGVCAESDAAGYPIEKFFAKPLPVEELMEWLSSAPA